jgi:ABC-type branched-subunit amino acid transport system ATPase component
VTTELLLARGLTKHYGGVHALQQVEVIQRVGETLGMIGPNGSGKTSFVNAVTGHLRLDSGRIEFAGQNITGASPHRSARAGLTRTYQAIRLFSRLSVRANLDTAAILHGRRGGQLESSLQKELLEWLCLDQRLDTPAGGLTLFEQRKLELAMRLMLRPRLVMLDEPVGGLAPREVREMMLILEEMKSRCGLFVIEHTMRVIRELADRVIVLITGEKVADGPPAEILKDKRVIEQYLGTAHA